MSSPKLTSALVLLLAIVVATWLAGADSDVELNALQGPGPGECPTDEPITYQLGTIDSEFDITSERARQVIDEAAALWNEVDEADLLRYDPEGEVVINLRYDDRQKLWDEKRQEQAAVDRIRGRHERVVEEYDALEEIYESDRGEYEALVDELKAKVESHHQNIQRWNDNEELRTNEQAERMEKAERAIEELQQRVRQREVNLERKITRLNELGKEANRTQDEVNRRIETFNKRFAEGEGFSKGEFIRQGQNQTIKIYQFDDLPDLRRALSHEFGHALGLQHANSRSAIMYYRMTNENRDREHLSSTDRDMILAHCGS